MIGYIFTALQLKAWSSCPPARGLYRIIGNQIGGRQRERAPMPSYYSERIKRHLELSQKYGILRPGDRVLELGTGWIHWEALSMRMFHDFSAVLYDVWDNRQFAALKSYAIQLRDQLKSGELEVSGDRRCAIERLNRVIAVESLEELYTLFGFEYVLDPPGMMADLPKNRFRMAVSAGVFEHLPREAVPEYVKVMASLMEPGGYADLSINITDHLYLYNRSAASPKQYLAYSDRTWKRWFENGVQYINRLQRNEWMDIFSAAGLTLVEEGGAYADISNLRLDPQYQNLTVKDRDCTTLDVLLRKA